MVRRFRLSKRLQNEHLVFTARAQEGATGQQSGSTRPPPAKLGSVRGDSVYTALSASSAGTRDSDDAPHVLRRARQAKACEHGSKSPEVGDDAEGPTGSPSAEAAALVARRGA